MISRMRFWLILSTVSLFTISGAMAQDAGPTHADWPHYGGTQFSWRYSALDQINTGNVKALTPAWMFQTGDYAENLQTTPIVENGVMYLITARARVFALDAATGREIWNYRYPEPARSVPGFIGNRGVAIGDGKVFFGTKDNSMVALDQKTGRLIWQSQHRRRAAVRLQHHRCAAGGEGQGHRGRHRRRWSTSRLHHGFLH